MRELFLEMNTPFLSSPLIVVPYQQCDTLRPMMWQEHSEIYSDLIPYIEERRSKFFKQMVFPKKLLQLYFP